MNKIIKFFTRRLVLVSLLILVQFLLIAATLMLPGKRYFAIYYLTTWVMGVIFMFRIINRKDNPVYKIGWLIIVLLLPPFGVYYSDVQIGSRTYCGMTNIGVKPTVSDEKHVTVETFLYDFKGDVYGETATVQLLTHRRPEMKFGSLEELKRTMEQDIQAGREYHGI